MYIYNSNLCVLLASLQSVAPAWNGAFHMPIMALANVEMISAFIRPKAVQSVFLTDLLSKIINSRRGGCDRRCEDHIWRQAHCAHHHCKMRCPETNGGLLSWFPRYIAISNSCLLGAKLFLLLDCHWFIRDFLQAKWKDEWLAFGQWRGRRRRKWIQARLSHRPARRRRKRKLRRTRRRKRRTDPGWS